MKLIFVLIVIFLSSAAFASATDNPPPERYNLSEALRIYYDHCLAASIQHGDADSQTNEKCHDIADLWCSSQGYTPFLLVQLGVIAPLEGSPIDDMRCLHALNKEYVKMVHIVGQSSRINPYIDELGSLY
jgi:hypothetical protein